MQAALGLLAAAALGLPNMCERVRFYVYGVYILLYTGVWLARHGVCCSVIEWMTRRSDLLSSGAEGAEQLRSCLVMAQFWDCWVWEQRWGC